MSTKKEKVKDLDEVVVRFAGDSGDGMQLTGSLFSDIAALAGNDFITFPDYPSEIRAPHDTVSGVSGYQVHIGHKKVYTSGDLADVLVAMNPASLKANLKWVKKRGTIIIDTDTFVDKALEKAGYDENPLLNDTLDEYNVIKSPITTLTKQGLKDLGVSQKIAQKSRNMFALGIMYFLFNRDFKATDAFFEKKFKDKPDVIEANKKVIRLGFNYAESIGVMGTTYNIQAAKLIKGRYRNITGNLATSWGLLAAAERSGRKIFLGSYPITPASDILIELEKHRQFDARVFQAEDEIAGVCSAVGASFAGALAVTSTSGPGLSLKSEAVGLAVMTELPIVIIDVQRGGPSTGLPTKTEQSDLLQALFGRNGECPTIVIAASSSSDSFYFAYQAAKLAMEHMTPVILLTDGYIANGSEVFKIPKMSELPEINPPIATPNDENFAPYKRDEKKLSRQWAYPGMEGLRHRIGGLEKEDINGNVSMDPDNHQLMTEYRQEKVARVANYIPDQEIYGDDTGDLLVVGWGGTHGALFEAVKQMREKGQKVSLAHFNYINPLPKNTEEVFSGFKKIIVCELNLGQFVHYLGMRQPKFQYYTFQKIKGLPFMVSELIEKFNKTLEEK